MTSFDYVDIPPYATRLQPASTRKASPPRAARRFTTSLPQTDAPGLHAPDSPPASPTVVRSGGGGAGGLLISSLSTALLAPTIPGGATNVRAAAAGVPAVLLTAKDPLSIPITTNHFRRFVPRVGPVFWLQDRIEEIVLWRCGNVYTCAWMAGYAFICIFPRLVLLIPNVILISILLSKYPKENAAQPTEAQAPVLPPLPREGSADWLANVQAIQNLMGAYSDGYDFVLPHLEPLLSHTSTSRLILLISILGTLGSIPFLPLLPLRPIALTAGLLPLVFTHPWVLARLPLLILTIHSLATQKRVPDYFRRLRDNDALSDAVWHAPLREVVLFENERRAPATPAHSAPVQTASPVGFDDARMFFPETGAIVIPATEGGWSKSHLRPGERVGWTRGADGWSGVGDGQVSNLTFTLEDGWRFVETEDWRPDLTASWVECGCDDFGWVYTNDAWQDPRPAPLDDWRQTGATRRRRWTRRIYLPNTKADEK